MPKIAIYPGSFDPVTNGHLDIIERGLKLFDTIIVAILTNPGKKFLFTLEERMQMLEICLKKFSNVEIGTFDGLTVDYAAMVLRWTMLLSATPRVYYGDCAPCRILSMNFRWR